MASELLAQVAGDYAMTVEDMTRAVKTQCFKGAASDAQLLMLLSFAKQYGLNPLAKECYAFLGTDGRMSIGVQVDGWSAIANRQANYDGQEIEYEYDDKGALVAITSRTYVRGRTHPVVYRAVLREWLRKTDVWTAMPTHQLYVKARNEGIRFAFGVPAYDPDDIERIAGAGVVETTAVRVKLDSAAVVTDTGNAAPASTTDAEIPPSAHHESLNDQPEASGTAGHPSTVEKPAGCQMKGCVAEPVETIELNGSTFWMCAIHAKGYKPRRPGRPRKAPDAPVTPAPAPTTPAETQRAAGLEVIDPHESPLETFIRVHDVPEKRVKLALAKYGAEKLADLDAAAADATLSVFKKSYGEVTA
ncbi:MAG: recombinase RecT [Candidatus Acidiferrales bacterium]